MDGRTLAPGGNCSVKSVKARHQSVSTLPSSCQHPLHGLLPWVSAPSLGAAAAWVEAGQVLERLPCLHDIVVYLWFIYAQANSCRISMSTPAPGSLDPSTALPAPPSCDFFQKNEGYEPCLFPSHWKNVAPLAMDTPLVVVEVGLLAFAKMEWNKGMKWKFPVRLMAAGAPATGRTCSNQTSQRWNSKPFWRRHLFSRHFYGIHLPTDIFVATLQRTFSLSCLIPSIAALAAATLRWRYLGKKRTYVVSRTWRNRHLNVWPIVIFDGEGSICSHLSYYQTTERSTLARPPEIKSPTSMTLGHASMANMLNYHI